LFTVKSVSMPIRLWPVRGRWLTVATYGVVLILLSLPIFSVTVPPLGDYPNHLARMHILAGFADSKALQANYVVSWKLEPYLAMDLVVPFLTRFMSVYTAGRVFLCACLYLLVLGPAAINAALYRRLSPWPAASALFAYGFVLAMGFVNYLFGIGIGLVAFAAWIVLSRGKIGWRIAGGSVMGLLTFFSHFFAFFGYGLCVIGYELGVWLAARDRNVGTLLRRLMVAGCTAILPIVIFLADLKEQQGGRTEFGAPAQKIKMLLSPLLFPTDRLDFASVIFVACVAIAILRLGWPLLVRPMRPVLIVLAGALVAMPTWLAGVWGVDYRLPLVLLLVLIGSLSWPRQPPRVAVWLSGLMLALLAADMVAISLSWRPLAAQYDEFRSALHVIAPGARVIVFSDTTGIDPALQRESFVAYRHMPALVVIERDAYLPYLFKNPMDPVQAAPALKPIDTPQGPPATLGQFIAGADPVKGPSMLGQIDSNGYHNYWGDWPHHYDYAIELSFGAKPALPSQLQRLNSGEIFSIYKISK
jgi:hypothetical protein